MWSASNLAFFPSNSVAFASNSVAFASNLLFSASNSTFSSDSRLVTSGLDACFRVSTAALTSLLLTTSPAPKTLKATATEAVPFFSFLSEYCLFVLFLAIFFSLFFICSV